MTLFKNELVKKIKYTLPALAFCLMLNLGATAQNDIPQQQDQQTAADFEDAELKRFANAAGKVVVIQQETEQKMILAIENEDLDINKFNEIMMAQQNQQTENLDATPEDLQKFDKAVAEVMKIQTEVQEEMVEAIKEEGLEPQKYEEILLAYQSNQEIKEKIDALINQ